MTDVLADYAEEQGSHTAAPWRIAYAVVGLASFWEGRTVTEVTRQTCEAYGKKRGRSAGTIRRESGLYGQLSITHTAKAVSHAPSPYICQNVRSRATGG